MSTSIPVASVVARLSPLALRTSAVPRFTASVTAAEIPWSQYASTISVVDLGTWLCEQLRASPAPRCIIFGEQHHQPGVLKAQLQLLHALASPPLGHRVTVLMEHFNLLQQPLLRAFAQSGDAEPLQNEYAKSREGFRITQEGYLPLLQLARELDQINSEIVAGFPSREWARTLMKDGKEGILADPATVESGALEGFDNWQALTVSPEHNAYIKASISGNRPVLDTEPKQGGLNAAQAIKDSIMAWKADQLISKQSKDGKDILIVICGSGHCEYDFGVTERIQACSRDQILLLVCKPDDGAYWKDESEQPHEEARQLADAIIVYEAI